MSDDVLIRVEGVSKKFCRDLKRSLWYGVKDTVADLVGRPSTSSLRSDEFWAVDDVSFELRRGECLGLIGRNGAGKTTLLKMLNGLIKPDKGRIQMRGRVGALIALGAGFNPILTGRENIYVNGSVLGLSKREIDQKFDEIVDFAEVQEFIDAPIQSYSSGMQVRLGFAVATAMEPDVLLLDEVLAVGDHAFKYKCFERIGSRLSKSAVVFVSHDSYAVRRICNRAMWLERGKSEETGEVNAIMDGYNAAFNQARQPEIVTANYIRNLSADARVISSRCIDGTSIVDLSISIKFSSSRDLDVSLALGNIVRNDEAIAGQFVFLEHLKKIRAGINNTEFVVPNIQLAMGTYQVTLVAFHRAGKELAFGARYFGTFEVSGNRRYGPLYAIATRRTQVPASSVETQTFSAAACKTV